jgi:hypothetical protein
MRARGDAKADGQSLRVNQGECAVMSPESDRFQEYYRRVQPRTAKEVRELVGLSADMAKAMREWGVCCQHADELATFPPLEELSSEDDLVRGRAFHAVEKGLNSYVMSTTPELLAPMEPAIDRYLELTGLALNFVSLADIYVADGATLTISIDTHLLEANDIVIEGSGRIKSSGYLKLNVNSISGV